MTTKTSLEVRWGATVLKHGWVAMPTALLLVQAQLKLSANAMNVLLNLFTHWWGDGAVYPSQTKIAQRMGVSKRTVQRAINELIAAGLLARAKTQLNSKYYGRNVYDLNPLVQRLQEISQELSQKEPRGAQDEAVSEIFNA